VWIAALMLIVVYKTAARSVQMLDKSAPTIGLTE
jgi:hypothetical protein